MGVKHTAGSNAVNFLPAGMQNFVTFIDTRPKITAPSQHLGLPGGAAGARDGTGCPVDICPILLVNLGCPRHEEKINVLVVTQLFTGLHIHSVTRRAISSVGQRQTAPIPSGLPHTDVDDCERVQGHARSSRASRLGGRGASRHTLYHSRGGYL